MKINSSQSEEGDSSWTLVNSLSNHTNSREVDSRDAETSLSMTSKEPVKELNVTECEDSEPRKEDLQRLTALMDGFKASKVTRDKVDRQDSSPQ